MGEQTAAAIVRGPEVYRLVPGDAFYELADEIEDLIAQRAYEMFAERGFAHGYDREDWLRAQVEIVGDVPVDITETETELSVRADVPGLAANDVEVRVAPRALCISGTRPEAPAQEGERTVYSERRSNRIFRAIDLPAEIDPDKAEATLENGILEIRLLKVGAGKKIPVRAKAASA